MPACTAPPGSRAGGCGSAEGSPRVLLAGMVCERRAKGYSGVQRAGTAALLQDRWSSLLVLRRRNNAFSDSCRPHRAELPGPTQSARMPTGAIRLGAKSASSRARRHDLWRDRPRVCLPTHERSFLFNGGYLHTASFSGLQTFTQRM